MMDEFTMLEHEILHNMSRTLRMKYCRLEIFTGLTLAPTGPTLVPTNIDTPPAPPPNVEILQK